MSIVVRNSVHSDRKKTAADDLVCLRFSFCANCVVVEFIADASV